MPIRPSVSENTRYLQRQINQQGTGRFGPMSIGPGEGHLRFYGVDGRVLFAVDSSGASVDSRGSLTGLSPLLDSLRQKNDDQDGTLGEHSSTLGQHSSTLERHSSRIDTLHSRQNSADQTNATQNGQIAQLRVDLTNESARIDNRATIGQLDATNTRVTNVESKNSTQDTRLANVEARNTAQDGRLDTLHSRANSQDTLNATQNGQISQLRVDVDNAKARADNAHSDAATAKARADAAYSLAARGATSGQVEDLAEQLSLLRTRVAALEAWRNSLPDR